MLRWPLRLCVIVLAFMPVVVWAGSVQQDALAWLTRMSRAMQMSNFTGNFVYLHNGQVESLQVSHYADRQGEYERLVHLNGNAREVIRNNDVVTCVFPEEGVVIVEKRGGSSYLPAVISPGNLSTISNVYRFSLGREERVAGQLARMIEVIPRDNFRYGYRIWVNVRNGLLMRSDLLDERGVIVEQILFTDIQLVTPIPRSRLQPSVDTRNFTWYRHDQVHPVKDAGRNEWSVRSLPDGFAVSEYHTRVLPQSKALVRHIIISDGMASISLYIQRTDENSRRRTGNQRIGGMNVYTSLNNGYQFTVMGDAPLPTVKRISDAVYYSGE